MSPTMTVVVLAVLWLIVVVPMVLRRKDERARERSVANFGQAMRALTRSPVAGRQRTEVFVAGARRTLRRTAPTNTSVGATSAGSTSTERVAMRRPVPAAQEALMHPVDRSDMSAARKKMMARRRRSLTVLGLGAAVTLLLGLVVGGLVWILAIGFLAGLTSYLWFLRTQALRDRDRRASRQLRAVSRQGHGYNATEAVEDHFEVVEDSVVRIDDDDISLHNMDTVDLTGLYSQADFTDPQLQRRAG